MGQIEDGVGVAGLKSQTTLECGNCLFRETLLLVCLASLRTSFNGRRRTVEELLPNGGLFREPPQMIVNLAQPLEVNRTLWVGRIQFERRLQRAIPLAETPHEIGLVMEPARFFRIQLR